MTPSDADIERAGVALRAGGVAILATDTVYGLVARADDARAIARIYDLKARPSELPLALLCATVEALLGALPQLERRTVRRLEALLPGPYTLVVPTTSGRFAALGGGDTVGVRVPALPRRAAAVATNVGPLASTSANRHGEPDPASLTAIDRELAGSVEAVVDDGPLPGTPSTVIDLTSEEPRVLREGAVSASTALAALPRI